MIRGSKGTAGGALWDTSSKGPVVGGGGGCEAALFEASFYIPQVSYLYSSLNIKRWNVVKRVNAIHNFKGNNDNNYIIFSIYFLHFICLLKICSTFKTCS